MNSLFARIMTVVLCVILVLTANTIISRIDPDSAMF